MGGDGDGGADATVAPAIPTAGSTVGIGATVPVVIIDVGVGVCEVGNAVGIGVVSVAVCCESVDAWKQ
jgi:hypothetical protein